MSERLANNKFDSWLKTAQRYEEPWRKSNQLCFEYYDGEQWTTEEQTAINERGQQATVINTIQPTIDMIRSLEIDKRADIQVVGREESDDDKAKLLTELLKHSFDTSQFDYFHSEAFKESLIGGRGWMEVSVSNDERGKDIIKVNQIPWENVYLDPCSRKPDASDARFIIKVKWLDRDIAKELFPDSADDINSVFNDDYKGQEAEAQRNTSERIGSDYYDSKTKRVKICECYYTKPEQVEEEVLDEISGKKKKKTILRNVIHYVIFSDEIILDGSADDDSKNVNKLGIDYFPLVPIYCTRDKDGRPKGVVKGLIDLQDQINKLNSKFLFTVASNRVLMESGAVNDPDEAREELQKPDGLVILNEGGLSRVRIDDKYRDLSYMSSHLQFLLSMEQRISGVNDSMLGFGGTNERSGVIQSNRISQGAAMQTSVIENMYFSKQRISQIVLRLIGKYYTDYRIIRITAPNGATDQYEFNKPERDITTGKVTGIFNQIDNIMLYDVILKKVPPFTSTRERTLQIFSEVIKSGVIPPPIAAELMISLADVPHKSDLILKLENFYKDQQTAMQQSAQPAAGLPI